MAMNPNNLYSAKQLANFLKQPKNLLKYNSCICELLQLFNEIGKQTKNEPAQSMFISQTIFVLLKACNAKKSEIKPVLDSLIEKGMKD
jgi:hypothetical protein